MAGEKIKGPFSYKVAKKILSQSDLERLACAFLAMGNVYQFDANKAALEFGGAKPDSFKRQIWVITKKIKAEMEKGEGEGEGDGDGDDDDDGGDEEVHATPKSGGKKRKAATSEGDVVKKARKGPAKKSKVEEEPVVAPGGDDEDEIGFL